MSDDKPKAEKKATPEQHLAAHDDAMPQLRADLTRCEERLDRAEEALGNAGHDVRNVPAIREQREKQAAAAAAAKKRQDERDERNRQ